MLSSGRVPFATWGLFPSCRWASVHGAVWPMGRQSGSAHRKPRLCGQEATSRAVGKGNIVSTLTLNLIYLPFFILPLMSHPVCVLPSCVASEFPILERKELALERCQRERGRSAVAVSGVGRVFRGGTNTGFCAPQRIATWDIYFRSIQYFQQPFCINKHSFHNSDEDTWSLFWYFNVVREMFTSKSLKIVVLMKTLLPQNLFTRQVFAEQR